MASTFSRLSRSLDDRRWLLILVVAAACGWWMLRGSISVCASSTTARVEHHRGRTAEVPSDDLRVVAEFPASAVVGRVRRGQHAHVRLSGLSWTQYGTLDARVTSVPYEPRGGSLRVELTLDHASTYGASIEDGLPGAVDIAVEHVTPWTLVRRSLGTGGSPPPPSATDDAPVAAAE